MTLTVNTQGRTLTVFGEMVPEMDIYPPEFEIERVMEHDEDVTAEWWEDENLKALCFAFASSLNK